jgi:hypothetical protein
VKRLLYIFAVLLMAVHFSCESTSPEKEDEDSTLLTFYVTCDMRQYTGENPQYFRGVCEKIDSLGAGDFMISPGDIDPPQDVLDDIRAYIGEDYPWYTVVGNHESETPSDMEWLRNYNPGGDALPNVVNTGPEGCEETTYSFDYSYVHFVVLNQYYDGVSDTGSPGDVADSLHQWLVDDLAANGKRVIIVIGHEPAYPLPDEESGRLRHEYDSLNQFPENRDRFWETLKSFGVSAYICGHTHNYSSRIVNGLLQIDAGHSRGFGDTGSRSTFIRFDVLRDGLIVYETYRLNLDSGAYDLTGVSVLSINKAPAIQPL